MGVIFWKFFNFLLEPQGEGEGEGCLCQILLGSIINPIFVTFGQTKELSNCKSNQYNPNIFNPVMKM